MCACMCARACAARAAARARTTRRSQGGNELLALPSDLLGRLLAFCSVRTLANLSRANRDFTSVVNAHKERLLQQLCDAATSNRRALLTGATTIYRMARLCGRRPMVPIKFYLQFQEVAQNVSSSPRLGYDVVALEVLYLAFGDLFHALYPRPAQEVVAAPRKPTGATFLEYQDLIQTLVSRAKTYCEHRRSYHPQSSKPRAHVITINDVEWALASLCRDMRPLGKSHRRIGQVEHTRGQ